jgi:2-methylcitrate dehydratase PrpD
MDFDLNTATQSVTGVIPAILPVAETTGATPSEMLAAFVVAAEIAARLFRAAPQGWRNSSWHGTGTNGTTAAAIASARLMKLPAERIPDVVGITASMAGGLNVNFGTMRSSNVASRIGCRIEGKRRQSEKSRRGMYNNLRWNRFKIGPKAALFLKTPPEI